MGFPSAEDLLRAELSLASTQWYLTPVMARLWYLSHIAAEDNFVVGAFVRNLHLLVDAGYGNTVV